MLRRAVAAEDKYWDETAASGGGLANQSTVYVCRTVLEIDSDRCARRIKTTLRAGALNSRFSVELSAI